MPYARISIPNESRRSRRAVSVAALIACLLAGTEAGAQDSRRGGYVGLNLGLADSSRLDSAVSAVSNPTRCDRLLYDDPALAPSGDPACTDTTPRQLSSNGFSPGPGFTGGFSAGYAFGGPRIEFEYRARTQGGDVSPLIESTANQAVVSKALEWSPVSPPTESISNYRAHQVFANVYYDFPNDSSWTPFLGAGAGLARTDLLYTRRLIRKTLDQGYQDVEPPLTLADRPATAAGTVSLLQPDLSGTLPGFQILGGLDYAVGERTSIGLKAHWARFGELSQNVTWSLIRSHEPVRADGTTPFSGTVTLSSFQYWGVTLGLKYRF